MTFLVFASFLERLETATARLEITDILVKLLRKMSGDEIDKGVYLMLGRLAPKFERLEFAMADKQVVKAISKTVGVSVDVITDKYKRVGDLGLVALSVKKQMSVGVSLSVVDVFSRLREIALDAGKGSQERKIDNLAKLLTGISAVEAKYIVRIILSRLRLGFSDKTILDALSVMEKGDKTARKQLDNIYQYRPDIGRLVKDVVVAGVDKTMETTGIEWGVPVLPALCQRLNTAEEIIEKMGEVGVEKKFDGTRVQIHWKKEASGFFVRSFTRNLDENSHMFPELKEVGEFIEAKSVILDTEAVGVDKNTGELLPFQVTVKRKRKHNIGEVAKDIPLCFFVFDILYIDGKPLVGLPYEERRRILAKVIRQNGILRVDKIVYTDSSKKVHSLHDEFLSEGLEGAVIKKRTGVYLPGRQGWNWVKIKESEGSVGKLSDTLDLVVMGFYRGKGKRAGFGVGAFLCGVRGKDGVLTLAKVGTGLTDKQFRELKKRLDKLTVKIKPREYKVDKNLEPDVWVEPCLVVEVAADEITRSPIHTAGVALRFPRLVRFRDDKGLDQITELEELESIKVA